MIYTHIYTFPISNVEFSFSATWLNAHARISPYIAKTSNIQIKKTTKHNHRHPFMANEVMNITMLYIKIYLQVNSQIHIHVVYCIVGNFGKY